VNATRTGPEFGNGYPIHWDRPDAVALMAVSRDAPAAYRAIVNRAIALRVLRLWASDLLVHDRTVLDGHDSARRFLWGIGETGTTLVWIDSPTRFNGHEARAWEHVNRPTRDRAASLVRSILDMRPHLHVWDGVSLSSCDADRAVALLAGEEDERRAGA
jgi:hypothetical protein